MEAARQGIVWGVVHFPQNFTDELVVRQSDGKFVDFDTIIGSQVNVSLDWSSKLTFSYYYQQAKFLKIAKLISFNYITLDNQIAVSLQRTLLEATEDFSRDIATACSYQPDVANIPLSVIINLRNISFIGIK